MTPDELLIELKKDATGRMITTLQNIYDVCVEQRNRGLSDFSFSTIARLGEGRGVPKAQSIRNKTGESYQALIKCFDENTTVQQSEKKHYKNKTNWIDEIDNVRLKILAGQQAAELAQAKRTIKEFTPPDMVININDGFAVAEEPLDNLERAALEYLLSEEFIEKWKLKKGIHGDLLDTEGERVFKIATLDALQKALKYL